jgi:hypothetical protein
MEPTNSEFFKKLQKDRLPKPVDIERISRSIAEERGNPDYYISPATWAEIERGTTPSIYKLFSLAVCLRMPYEQLMQVFGVDPRDTGLSSGLDPERSELVRINLKELGFSLQLDFSTHLDIQQTNLLQASSPAWQCLPAPLLERLNPSRYRYAVIGLEDDTMGDLMPPGSLIEIDPKQTSVESFAWKTLRERPAYVISHGQGHSCGWCQREGEELLLLPHPLSKVPVKRFIPPEKAEIIGRVVSVWFF